MSSEWARFYLFCFTSDLHRSQTQSVARSYRSYGSTSASGSSPTLFIHEWRHSYDVLQGVTSQLVILNPALASGRPQRFSFFSGMQLFLFRMQVWFVPYHLRGWAPVCTLESFRIFSSIESWSVLFSGFSWHARALPGVAECLLLETWDTTARFRMRQFGLVGYACLLVHTSLLQIWRASCLFVPCESVRFSF